VAADSVPPGRPPLRPRSPARWTARATCASPAPPTPLGASTGADKSRWPSSATPSRSPSATSSSAPTRSATTAPGSMVLWPTLAGDRTASTPPEGSRCQVGTGVRLSGGYRVLTRPEQPRRRFATLVGSAPVGRRSLCSAAEPVGQHGGGGLPREPWIVAFEHEHQTPNLLPALPGTDAKAKGGGPGS